MRKSFDQVTVLRGRGVKDTLMKQATEIVSVTTDDSHISLGLVMPFSKTEKHVRIATCTNAAKHEWTVMDFFKPRIVEMGVLS